MEDRLQRTAHCHFSRWSSLLKFQKNFVALVEARVYFNLVTTQSEVKGLKIKSLKIIGLKIIGLKIIRSKDQRTKR